MQHIIQKDPQELKPHAKVKELARWEKGSDSLNSLCDSIREDGILVPLIITEDGRIMDGVTRCLAAKQLQLATVPCQIQPETRLEVIAIGTETQRRHLTKSQLAFKYYGLVADVFGERSALLEEMRRGQNGPAQGASRIQCAKLSKRVIDFAAKLGVSERLLEQSHQLHTLFDSTDEIPFSWTSADAKKLLEDVDMDPAQNYTLREYFSAAIMRASDPMSLGGAIAGAMFRYEQRRNEARGQVHTGNSPKQAEAQLRLFNRAVEDTVVRWDYWKNFDPAKQEEHFTFVREKIKTMPADRCAELAEYHKTLAKLYRRGSSEE